ncbi:ABC transporter ATP-binding protein [Aeromicrobium sp. CTD01-1L150]|uniref:ABC transporter ATP-binding protein n=1 Tax=Aeromicrobium sp. CTD01-1L150 TaxID=3341830 RepID=UPI0035C05A7A
MIARMLALTSPRGRRLIAWLLAITVATAVVQGVAFAALVPFLDGLFSGDRDQARTWMLVLGALAGGYAVLAVVVSLIGQRSGTEILHSLLIRLGDRLVQLPIGYYGRDRSGDLSQLATHGIVFASSVPYALLRPMLTAFITPTTVMICTFFIDWRIALTMLASAPVIWLTYRFLARRIASADAAHVVAAGEAAGRLVEFARTQPALRAAGHNSIGQRLVGEALSSQHRANRRVHTSGGAAIAIFGIVVQCAVAALIAMTVWLTLDGAIAAATAIALLVLAARFTEPVIHSGALGGALAVARNTLDAIQDLLDETTLSEPTQPTSPAEGSVRFDDVTFAYTDTPVLRGLTFEAPAGAMTAIVGPSGSGKTTITRLIARFHEPQEGTVSIGGVPLAELGSNAVAAMVSPVFQDVYLFDGTLIENIAIGNPSASREQLEDAARRARVDEIVERLPASWDTRVGEGGTNLSGGERQRVSIARALLKDAPIVLLDEATAALDVDNESAINDAFQALRRDRTVIVVAHRLQTIASADQILMLDEHGTIIERGTHATLLAADARYAGYWTERLEASQWRLTAQTAQETTP